VREGHQAGQQGRGDVVGQALAGAAQGDQVVLVFLGGQGAFGGLLGDHEATLGQLLQEGQQGGARLAEEQHGGGGFAGAVGEAFHGFG
ncbi:hypothetical protein DK308_15630, partial [Listeria monocytogenes]